MSLKPFPVTEAQIVSLFMESVFYGIYLVTFGLCLRVLLFERERLVCKRPSDINWGMLLVAFLLATFSTLEAAFDLKHNLDAFVSFTGSGGPTAELGDISNWVNIIKSVNYVAQTAIGDAILIYRLYAVYGRSWKIVVLPILLWAATSGSGSVIIWIESTTTPSETVFLGSYPSLFKWIDCMCVFTLVLNVLVTSLIIRKLWIVRSRVLSVASDPDALKKVIRIVLDSGLIYTTCVVAFFATTLARSSAQYPVSDVVVQVIGITFNLIIIRVNEGRGPSTSILHTTITEPQGDGAFPLHNIDKSRLAPAFTVSGRAEVRVDVTHVTDVDQDNESVKASSQWKGTGSVEEDQVC